MHSKSRPQESPIEIAGAGPAGLAAAVTIARAGRQVVVHEIHAEVGYRFRRDLQGLENWTTEQDVLLALEQLGITTEFDMLPCRQGTVFDAWDQAYPVHSKEPLFYMIERGSNPGSLDSALLSQALDLGVEVRFKSRLDKLHGPGILAVGPKAADAIAVGYHFDTSMANGFWAICDHRLAPQGYAYLLIMNGKGTVKSCMFTDFKQEKLYVERTVTAFERLVGLKMDNPRPHGGVGNFRMPTTALSGKHPVAGEFAGFQDTLWGFGIRHAILSGIYAARSLLEGKDYDIMWQQALAPLMKTAIVNRALYDLLSNRGYRWCLRRQGAHDARDLLRSQYHPSLIKRLLSPWARTRIRYRRQDKSCNHVDCNCVWCRCGGTETTDSASG